MADCHEAICKGGCALYGSVENTFIAINEQLLHMGRTCLARLAIPGYVTIALYLI